MKNTTLKNKLNKLIENTSKNKLIKTLNYNNKTIGFNTLNKFLNTKDIYEWLNNGHYDFKYNSEVYLLKLCKIFEISSKELELEINKARKKINYINNSQTNLKFSLTVRTKWSRTVESITVLSLAGNSLRNLNISKDELYNLNELEELSLVKEKIKEHYLKYKNIVPIFGKVEYFKYISNFNKIYRFKIIENKIEELKNKNYYFRIIENYEYLIKEILKVNNSIENKNNINIEIDNLYLSNNLIGFIKKIFYIYLNENFYYDYLTDKEIINEINLFLSNLTRLLNVDLKYLNVELKREYLT
jgi:hypothetical protein